MYIGIAILIGGLIYGWNEYHRTNKSLIKVHAAFLVNVEDFVREFENSDSMASNKYLGKVVTVYGRIKQIETDPEGNYTVVLAGPQSMTSVRCAMDTGYKSEVVNVKKSLPISIKGTITGYQKDETGLLGSDIKLNRCVIEDKNRN
jgi:hypothetical protein